MERKWQQFLKNVKIGNFPKPEQLGNLRNFWVSDSGFFSFRTPLNKQIHINKLKRKYFNVSIIKGTLTLSLLGTRKTEYAGEMGLILIPCLMSKYDKWYIIGKLLCSTFRIWKNAKLQKIDFFAKSNYEVKMFAKKCPKMIKYTFLKSSWPWHFRSAIMFAKFK